MGEVAGLMPDLLHRLPSGEAGDGPVTTHGKGDTVSRALWVTSQGEQKKGQVQEGPYKVTKASSDRPRSRVLSSTESKQSLRAEMTVRPQAALRGPRGGIQEPEPGPPVRATGGPAHSTSLVSPQQTEPGTISSHAGSHERPHPSLHPHPVNKRSTITHLPSVWDFQGHGEPADSQGKLLNPAAPLHTRHAFRLCGKQTS